MVEGREEEVFQSLKQTMDARHGVDIKREHWLHLFDRPELCPRVGRLVSEALVDITYTGDHSNLDILERIKTKEFLPFVLASYLRRTVEDPHRSSLSLPYSLKRWALWTFCRVVQLFTTDNLFQESVLAADPDTRTDFIQYCEREKCAELVVLVDALCRDWNSIPQFLKDAPEFPDHDFSSTLLWFCHEQGADSEVLFSLLLSQFDRGPRRWLRFDPGLFSTKQLKHLAEQCASSEWGLLKWQVFFLVQANDWTGAMTIIASDPHNQEVRIRAIFLAAASGRFNEAKTLYESCSSADVIEEARRLIWEHSDLGPADGERAITPRHMAHVNDALYLHYLHRAQRHSELFNIIEASVHRPPEQGLEFAYLCIRQGLATHYQNGERLCEDCIKFNKPKLLRLLLEAGAIQREQYNLVTGRRRVQASLLQEIEQGDPCLTTGDDTPSWLQRGGAPSLQQLTIWSYARYNNRLLFSMRDHQIDNSGATDRTKDQLKFKTLSVYLNTVPFE